MLNREKYEQYIVSNMGEAEKPISISPGTLDVTGQIAVQGFVALTPGFLVFLQESGLGGIQMQTYARNQMGYKGTTYGLIGKTYVFDAGGVEVKVGGVELPFEQIIENNFSSIHPPTAPGIAPSAPMPPPSVPMPPPSAPMHVPPPIPRPPSTTAPPAPFMPTPPPDEIPQYVSSSGSKGPMLAVVIMMAIIILLGAVGYLFLSSTKKEVAVPATNQIAAPDEESTAPTSSTGAPKANLILILNPSGREMINIRKKESGDYKVWVEGTTYKGKVEQDRVKIKDDAGNTLLKVKAKEAGSFKITDGADAILAKIKPDGAGFKVSDETTTIAKIKAKGDGFTVTDGSGAAIGSVEPDGDNWKVLDAAGTHLFTVRGSQGKTAAAVLALKDNSAIMAALLLYLNEF